MIKNIIALMLVLSAFPSSQAEVFLSRVQVESYNVFQSSGGSYYTSNIYWTPTWNFSDTYYLRSNLGVGLLKSTANSSLPFYTLQFLIGKSAVISNLGIEFGVGARTWTDSSKNYSCFALNFPWMLSSPTWGLIDRYYFGVSQLQLNPNQNFTATELRAGVGLVF